MGLIEGFEERDVTLSSGVRIRAAVGGEGPPLLLLHGHPQTHATWSAVAPELARTHTVVATDLRGYGDSDRPPSTPDHEPYTKRAMAADQVGVMRALGHERFAVVGHDRGGRVAHRLALDHASAVTRLAVLDIAPTAAMYAATDRAFATSYFWWFFLIQDEPLPERLIEGDLEFFLRTHLRRQSRTEGIPDEAHVAEYLRCYRIPGTVHAICEDYRAAAGPDLVHDDEGARLTQPLLALWGADGVVGRQFDVLSLWRDVSDAEVTGYAVPGGHLVQEERPETVTQALLTFLTPPP